STVVTIFNEGPGLATLNPASITGEDKSAFTLHNSCPSQLMEGQSCPISIHFAPIQAGLHSVILTVSPVRGTSAVVPIMGYGPEAKLQVSKDSLSFSPLPVGEMSPSQRVIVSNVGEAPVTIHRIQVTSGADSFGASHNCP